MKKNPFLVDVQVLVQQIVQVEISKVCKANGLQWGLHVGRVRSEDGYFKAEVTPVFEAQSKARLSIQSGVIRSVCAEVEDRVEQQYQGLRIQLEAPVGKSAVKAKKAS